MPPGFRPPPDLPPPSAERRSPSTKKAASTPAAPGGLPHYLCEDLDSLNKAIQAKETELNAQGITAHLRHEVRGIDAAARKVTVCDLATGRVFEDHYDKLVLATGSSNRVPQVPGSDRVGVQTLKTVEDLIFLKEFVRTPYVRDIVILGGSWAGLEIAKSFLKLGRNVRIIEKEQQLLPQFDPEVSKLIQKELEAQGVQFNLGEQVRSFPGRTFVEQVQTNRGTYPCDLCVVAIGVTPNTGLLAGTRGAAGTQWRCAHWCPTLPPVCPISMPWATAQPAATALCAPAA